MNLFAQLKEMILIEVECLQQQGKLPEGLALEAITCEPPRDPSHGDVATNVALVLGKPAKKNPREVAEMLKTQLEKIEDIASVDIAGPGFINLRLQEEVVQRVVHEIVRLGTSYGNLELGENTPINVEYVSANPTGPLHIGHARGAILGDALARLLAKAGYDVTKEYYINDAGAQVDTLARSVYLRYREALGETIEIPEGLYPGEYLKPVGKALAQEHGDRFQTLEEAEWLPTFRDKAIEAMMALIKDDLSALGIRHDVFTSERELMKRGLQDKAFEALQQAGLIYQGVLEPPKGKMPEDWEPREQTLFKATKFGDDVDRAMQKSDGSWTYFAGDAAYHHDKLARGFQEMAIVLGADHGGYQKRLQAVVKALSADTAQIDVILSNIVKFFDKGEPVKMSKRAGTFLTAHDVVEAVGKDVVRFIMLTRKPMEMFDFDYAKVTEQSKDNPVFYVQYAHARAYSVFRQANEAHITEAEKPDLSLLDAPSEQALIRKLAEWPRVIEQAAKAREPHRVAYYLQEVAASFHALWNEGKGEEQLRFILPDDVPKTQARLAMVRAMAIVIASGLEVMGVSPVESM